jgi:hypothetical protein
MSSPFIKANLRVWSDRASLKPLAESGQFLTARAYHAGEPIITDSGTVSRARARRNYLSTTQSEFLADDAAREWLDRILETISTSPLAGELRAGRLEAILWLAAFQPSELHDAAQMLSLSERAARLGIEVLIEDHASFSEQGAARQFHFGKSASR